MVRISPPESWKKGAAPVGQVAGAGMHQKPRARMAGTVTVWPRIVVEGPTVREEPMTFSEKKYLAAGTLLGLASGLIIALFAVTRLFH